MDNLTKKKYLLILVIFLFILSFQGCSNDAKKAEKKILADLTTFHQKIKPIIDQKCLYCHGPKRQRGDFRIDQINPNIVEGKDDERWHELLDLIILEDMPPLDKADEFLTDQEFTDIEQWIRKELEKRKKTEIGNIQPVLRRLTKVEYSNTIKDLLGINVDAGELLPPEALSKDGFKNNGETLIISPLHIRYFLQIARTMLDKVIVTSPTPPKTYRYRWIFGRNLNNKIKTRALGYQSSPLPYDFVKLSYFDVKKNDFKTPTYHSKFPLHKILTGDFRGSKQERFYLGTKWLTLMPMIPNKEVKANVWQGPSPNLTILAQDYPEVGDFRVTVLAKPLKNSLPNIDIEEIIPTREVKPRITWDKKTKVLLTPEDTILKKVNYPTKKVPIKDKKDNNKIPTKDKNKDNNKIPTKDKNKDNNKIPTKDKNKDNNKIPTKDKNKDNNKIPTKDKNKDNNKIPTKDKNKDNKPRFKTEITSRKVDITVNAPKAGYYQLDASFTKKYNKVTLGKISFNNQILTINLPKETPIPKNFGAIKLRKGDNLIKLDLAQVKNLAFTPIKPNSVIDKILKKGRKEKRNLPTPYLKFFMGNRTDDGMQYKTAEESMPVNKSKNFAEYQFEGRLENFPLPLTKNKASLSKEFLTGTMIIGLWNDIIIGDNNITDPAIAIKQIEFEAPIFSEWPPKQHKAIFIPYKFKANEALYARKILKNFLFKAYRRPPKTNEINKFVSFWKNIRSEFATFEESIKETLIPVLCSTSFLYRPETVIDDRNNPKDRLNEYELASRLSYFLWSSMPDNELLKLASKNRLRKNLTHQINRLLSDPKSKRFTSEFTTQWLDLEKLDTKSIKIARYPKYNRYIKKDYEKETKAFVHEILTKNMSILNFIHSDFVMVNQNLAQFYKLKEKVHGPKFRPVKISNARRGGLMTQGSFLTGHSTGEDSHPIKRGVWLAKKLLDSPPPKPPPNVPEIPLEDPEVIKKSVKEQLAAHRDKISCRSCHQNIDPWGIIFENYDATGSWRTKIYRSLPSTVNYKGNIIEGETITLDVDTTTETPDGTVINGIEDAKKYIIEKKKKKFILSVVKHFLTYAIGRSLSYKDEDIIKNIVKKVEKGNYKAYSLVEEIVKSDLFFN